MHILLIVLLVVVFAYSITLVLLNNSEVAVNLLFANLVPMNLGLVLVASIFLGVLIGILLALLMFRVLQNKWEISRLKKEVRTVQAQLTEANIKLAQMTEKQAEPTVVSEEPTTLINQQNP
ncbi:LapA family protein [Moraxella nasicaprae]|uniref:LapA family protein n=1 Tax=Moraxella nasicaprae TaxID=2904122 RepID=A0ABY6F3M4_9GAMM|nr:LapA family protein [Moraxella nasicaprae]UXZ04698.1 LapA family protein [Moraxella nasicaprae]